MRRWVLSRVILDGREWPRVGRSTFLALDHDRAGPLAGNLAHPTAIARPGTRPRPASGSPRIAAPRTSFTTPRALRCVTWFLENDRVNPATEPSRSKRLTGSPGRRSLMKRPAPSGRRSATCGQTRSCRRETPGRRFGDLLAETTDPPPAGTDVPRASSTSSVYLDLTDRTPKEVSMNRRRLVWLVVGLAGIIALGPPGPGGPGAAKRSRRTTRSTNTRSRCATGSSCSRRSWSPRRRPSRTRSCSTGPLTPSRPTARTRCPGRRARRPRSPRRATSSPTRTSGAAGCRRGSSSTCGRSGRIRPPAGSTSRPTPTTRSTGWSRTSPTTTAGSASGESRTRASTPPAAWWMPTQRSRRRRRKLR